MKSGYRVRWTNHALSELQEAYAYLEEHWSPNQLHDLSITIEHKVRLISQNPYLFQKTSKDKNIRRAVVKKLNSLYYRINGDEIEILSFFANRRNPKSNKLKK